MQFTRHTLCGPSSLERRALCPGSLAQESWLDRGDEKDADADRGTACHAAMEAFVLGLPEPELTDDEARDVAEAKKALEMLLMGDEILRDTVILPNGEIANRVRRTRGGATVYVELELLDLPYSSESTEIGTMDLVFIYEDHILLIDWKFGGSFVPAPKWNLQLKGYALGLWKDFPTLPIHVAIVQPQVMVEYQVVPWVYEPEERDQFFSELSGIVARCHREPDFMVVGKACQFCQAARHVTCPAIQKTLGAFASINGAGTQCLEEMTSMELGRVMAAAKAAEKAAIAIVGQARKLAMAGKTIDGWSCNQDSSGSYRLARKAMSPGWPKDAIEHDHSDKLRELLFAE